VVHLFWGVFRNAFEKMAAIWGRSANSHSLENVFREKRKLAIYS